MSFRGVNINRINGGLGGGESAGRVAVTVTGCGAIGDTLEVNRAYELLQASDADAPGITEQHDGSAHRSDRYQISEVFRLAPDTRIYLIAVPETVKASDLKNLTVFVTALRSIEGLNTIALTGMAAESDIKDGITGMQILVDSLAGDHICGYKTGGGQRLPYRHPGGQGGAGFPDQCGNGGTCRGEFRKNRI